VKKTHQAMFGAGCFWGVEAAFRKVKGVRETSVGYSGGHFENPTYENVCSGKTGHTEVVQMEYDPDMISYEDLLEIFWKIHDPTTPNQQGPDVGTQYRSAIYFYAATQESAAKRSKEAFQMVGVYQEPIVTEIAPAQKFYRAEEYHQRYLEKGGSCH